MLEDEHPPHLWVYVERASQVERVERRRSAFELVAWGRLVEIEMDGVE